jgi:hypothetical protein
LVETDYLENDASVKRFMANYFCNQSRIICPDHIWLKRSRIHIPLRIHKMSRIPGEMLPGIRAAGGSIPTGNKLRGLQNSRLKKRRSQKSSVWMMKRLIRTGALPRHGSPGEAVGANCRNGL